jgi:arylsulfatase A-like enzyme
MLKLNIMASAVALVVAIATSSALAAEKPNILLILTDDQRTEDMDYMPFLASKKASAHYFRRYYHSMSMCCPSRASILTGMYPQNHGIVNNKLPDGGYLKFRDDGLEADTWGLILRLAANYRTALHGKYLNDYRRRTREVPKGWWDWFALHTQYFFDYTANSNGTVLSFGADDKSYQTNVLADRTVAFIRRISKTGGPFAIMFTPTCPHVPSTPALAYAGTYANEPFAPGSKPNFDEEDVSDKPSAIQMLPRITQEKMDQLIADWHKRLECQRSVDDAIARFWSTLAELGILHNTYIFFTTDNGWLQGEHRIDWSKSVPYVEAIESRLYVWGPHVIAGEDTRLVGNIDLMPTFLHIAGVKPSTYPWIDGRSLLPLLRGMTPRWRKTFYIQGRPAGDSENGAIDTGDRTRFRSIIGADDFGGIYIFTQYVGDMLGEYEFYDLVADPHQLDNAYSSLDPARAAAMQARIDTLSTCSGQSCRMTENRTAP